MQEVYAATLERPPLALRSLRGWLARATVHRAQNAARGERRRGRREEAAARPERVEHEDTPLERLEIQRVLIELLMTLPAEQREVRYLRYYEDLGPEAIAARLAVPVKTVKTRHTRALAELRERLDRRSGGDRAAWMSALAPIVNLRPIAA